MSAGLTERRPIMAHPIDASFGAELAGVRVAGDVPDADIATFLDALHRHHVVLVRDVPNDPAAQDRYIYRHRWRAGDLVAWDNRSVLHTASLFDHTRYTRLMFRTTVAGTA